MSTGNRPRNSATAHRSTSVGQSCSHRLSRAASGQVITGRALTVAVVGTFVACIEGSYRYYARVIAVTPATRTADATSTVSSPATPHRAARRDIVAVPADTEIELFGHP